jgi:hypothetical protein
MPDPLVVHPRELSLYATITKVSSLTKWPRPFSLLSEVSFQIHMFATTIDRQRVQFPVPVVNPPGYKCPGRSNHNRFETHH